MFKKKSASRELPLDVSYTKLLDWLAGRKLLQAGWSERLDDVDRRRVALAERLPKSDEVPEISAALADERAGYFECVEVMRLLEAHDPEHGGAKNLLGQYKSQLLHDWSKVLQAYERHNIFLGEAARILSQISTYEVPALKKSKSENDKQLGDMGRKVIEIDRSITEVERNHAARCAELGVDATKRNYRAELPRLVDGLPALYEAVAGAAVAEPVAEALQYYDALGQHLSKLGDSSASVDVSGRLASLRRLCSEGSALVPSADSLGAGAGAGGSGDGGAALEIDWCVDGADAGGDGGGGDGGDAAAGGIDIDWDIGVVEGAGEGDGGGAAEIDWDIGTAASSADATDVVATDSTAATTTADVGADLGDKAFRTALLNDVTELNAFLVQRAEELRQEEGGAYVTQFQSADKVLQNQSVGQVQGYADAVSAIHEALTSPELHMRIMVQTSPLYVDRVVSSLQQADTHVAKLRATRDKTALKKQEMTATIEKANTKLKELGAFAKALKSKLEGKLASLCNGRTICVTGVITA